MAGIPEPSVFMGISDPLPEPGSWHPPWPHFAEDGTRYSEAEQLGRKAPRGGKTTFAACSLGQVGSWRGGRQTLFWLKTVQISLVQTTDHPRRVEFIFAPILLQRYKVPRGKGGRTSWHPGEACVCNTESCISLSFGLWCERARVLLVLTRLSRSWSLLRIRAVLGPRFQIPRSWCLNVHVPQRWRWSVPCFWQALLLLGALSVSAEHTTNHVLSNETSSSSAVSADWEGCGTTAFFSGLGWGCGLQCLFQGAPNPLPPQPRRRGAEQFHPRTPSCSW